MGPELIGSLADKHLAALTLYARQWCATPEDVVQEALLKLLTLGNIPENPVPWLYRVVRNAAVSMSRSAQRRQRHENVAASLGPSWFAESELNRIDADAATAALGMLPLDQREVIVAHLWGGLTFVEIAELCGSSSSTAHRRYLAGLAGLRERLGVPCPPNRETPSSTAWPKPWPD
jgi:RNA polymerase sigma factor (sigma-70 family)